jgi:hypothetical protein
MMEDAGRVRLPRLALVQVANVFPGLAAISPNVVLNEPGKEGGEGGVELPAVNVAGQVLYHPQTSGSTVAPGPIGMVSPVVGQNPGPVEEVVHQAVDGNHLMADAAVVPAGIGGEEEPRQRHLGELRADVGNGRDLSDEALEELTHGLIGLLSLPKVLPDIGVKVPRQTSRRKKYSEKAIWFSAPFFMSKVGRGHDFTKAGSAQLFVVFR